MKQVMQPPPNPINFRPAPPRLRRKGFLETWVPGLTLWALGLLVVHAVLGENNLLAQTDEPQVAKAVPHQQKAAAKPAQTRRAAGLAFAASTQSQPAPEAIDTRPAASPTPIWSVNQPPNQARVSWDSRGLEIEASNSSLDQILRQVAADTGAKLEFEGFTQDQRVFGSYGPGPGCEVLSKLLDGSGYNVLMTGSRDADAPLEIILSPRSPASPWTANSPHRGNSGHSEAGEQLKPEPQPDDATESPRPQPIENPFGNGEAPRDPLQFMQEILQRQQKIDQQQQQKQQDQQNNPPQ